MQFIDNKYNKWYYQIVNRAKSENRKKYEGVYYESHHILPKSLGGSNKKYNLVLLTAREHFVCHWLLCKMTTGQDMYKMKRALSWLAGKSKLHKGRGLTSKQYEIARKYTSEVMSNLPEEVLKARTLKSAETLKRRFANGELVHYNKGGTRPEWVKKKIRVPKPEGYAEKKSIQMIEYYKTNVHPMTGKTGVLNPSFGRKRTLETCKLISEIAFARTKKTCPHCDRSFDPGNYVRYHGDKCKSQTPTA